MKFAQLASLIEMKKKKADDEMEFEVKADDEGGEKEEGEGCTKADVMKFLKDCDAECRAEIHDKLMAMVEADKAEAAE